MSPKKSKYLVNSTSPKLCNSCNPKKYLKFNFSFVKENGKPATNDVSQLLERLKFLSSDIYKVMKLTYQGNKKSFIEDIPVEKLKWNKNIPEKFREIFPAETNEKYAIFRLYPAGTPKGTANPRVIGMIKNTIFYVFYIDWKGTLYEH